MRSSAGSKFRWNTRPASTRVKCRDSLTGWKSWRIVARWTGRSLIGSCGVIGRFATNGVLGNMPITALA